MRSLAASLALVSAALVSASPAFAAPSPQDQAAADVLFKEAKALMAAGDFAKACPKFTEANRLVPTGGTFLSVGDCLEKQGLLASSWGAFKGAELFARSHEDPGREGEAARRAALLAPRLSKLAIVVPPLVKVPGFEVKRDGEPVGEAQWGSMMPVDAGHHVIEASAPGRKPWSVDVRVEENASAMSIEVSPLEKLPDLTPTAAPAGNSAQKPIGYTAIGVGGAALIVGAITAGLDGAKNASLLPQCPMAHCPASLQSSVNSYQTLSLVSSSSLIIGGALAVTGLIVVLVAPKTEPPAVAPVVGLGYAGLAGRF